MRLFPAFIVTALACLPAMAQACPRSNQSATDEFQQYAQSVVTGTMVGHRDLISDGSVAGTFYTIQIDRTLKGAPLKSITAFGNYGWNSFSMEDNVPYLLFLSSQHFQKAGDSLYVIPCGHSGKLADKADVLKELDALH